MSMNFADAPTRQFGESSPILPGTLAWVNIGVEWFNAQASAIITPSRDGGSKHLKLKLTIADGPYKGREIIERIGIEGKEEYTNNGRAQIRAILEGGFGANPNNLQSYIVKSRDPGFANLEPSDWRHLSMLHGGVVPVEISSYKEDYIDQATGQTKTAIRTGVKRFLSPFTHPEVFARLQAGWQPDPATPIEYARGKGPLGAAGAVAPQQGAPAYGASTYGAPVPVAAPAAQPQAPYNGQQAAGWMK